MQTDRAKLCAHHPRHLLTLTPGSPLLKPGNHQDNQLGHRPTRTLPANTVIGYVSPIYGVDWLHLRGLFL